MTNVVENLVEIEEFIKGFKSSKAVSIAHLLFSENYQVTDFMDNFSDKGFSKFDDLITYRDYRIATEDASYCDFDLSYNQFGICHAVGTHFYQPFDSEEVNMVENLFLESGLSPMNIFDKIRENTDLSIYKMIL